MVRAGPWGPGSAWALARVGALVGVDDRPDDLVPRHRVVADAARRLRGLRIGRTEAVLEALVPAILEQKVPGDEARRAWARDRALRRARAGPAGSGSRQPPTCSPALPYYAYHPRRRAATGRADPAAQRDASGRSGRAGASSTGDRRRYARLRAVPGIGPWTAAEVAVRALGDPDAVSVGDFHLPNLVAFALAGEPTRARMSGCSSCSSRIAATGPGDPPARASAGWPPRRAPRLSPQPIDGF